MSSENESARKKAEREAAAAQREDYLRALGEELAGAKAADKSARVKAIQAEIARVKKGPTGRQAPDSADADAKA